MCVHIVFVLGLAFASIGTGGGTAPTIMDAEFNLNREQRFSKMQFNGTAMYSISV